MVSIHVQQRFSILSTETFQSSTADLLSEDIVACCKRLHNVELLPPPAVLDSAAQNIIYIPIDESVGGGGGDGPVVGDLCAVQIFLFSFSQTQTKIRVLLND